MATYTKKTTKKRVCSWCESPIEIGDSLYKIETSVKWIRTTKFYHVACFKEHEEDKIHPLVKILSQFKVIKKR